MFEVNRPALDYLTLTSFNPRAMRAMFEWHEAMTDNHKDAKRMQYVGRMAHDRYGSAFLGVAEQKSMTHSMLQVSGLLAETAWTEMKQFVLAGQCKVTRLDLQVTVDYPRDVWSQSDLADEIRAEMPNRSISYVESRSGPQKSKLATVYVGSRQSDRLYRIYEKLGMADEVLLRFEVEYKGQRAVATANALLADATIKGLLWHEVLLLPDVYNMRRIFGKVLETSPYAVRVVRDSGNTEEWLKTSVLPALDRYLNQHESNALQLAQMFYDVIEPVLTNGQESTIM